MTRDVRRIGQETALAPSGPQPTLDYYVVGSGGNGAEGVVVEEFVLTGDHRALGLNSAGWTAADGRWWSSAAFARAMREEPEVRVRVTAVGRREAEDVYRRLGGGELPGEAALRAHFSDFLALPDSAPLRLGSPQAPEGFLDQRVYRVLFTGEPDLDRLDEVVTPAEGHRDPRTRIVGTGRLRAGQDMFAWDLRRVGPGIACSLDLTASLGTPSGQAVGPLLRTLTTALRHAGLIPVTVERFS